VDLTAGRAKRYDAAMDSSNKSTPIQPESGGIGGLCAVDARTGGQDLRLIRRAIVNGWNVPPDIKRTVIEEMSRIVAGKNERGEPIEVSARNRISAARVLVAADSVDARVEAVSRATTQVNVNVSNETRINLDRLTDAELEALERIHRKLDEKHPSPLQHDGQDGHSDEPDASSNGCA
jgi:hypothetical protein